MTPRPLLAILGAGDSRRMGRPKILLETGGHPHLLQILETAQAAGISDYLIACQADHLSALETLGLPASHLHPVPSSLRARGPIGSLASLLGDTHALSQFSPEGLVPEGLMLWPVDHPHVQVATLEALLAAPGPLRVPIHQARRGHPVWIASALWPRIGALADQGKTLKTLFHEHQAQVTWVPVRDEGVVRNLNQPEDLG